MSEPSELERLRRQQKSLDELAMRHLGSTSLTVIRSFVDSDIRSLEAKLETEPPSPAEPADRDRILVTACKLIAADETIKDGQTLAGYLLQLTRCGGAKPYEVKERTNEQ